MPHEEERREEIPKFGVALAATLASTAFAALSPEQEKLECREGDDHLYRKPAAPVPPHLYRPPDAVDADDHLWTMPVNGGAAVSASVAEWGAAAAQPLIDALPDGFCVQDAIEYADLSGYTYHVDDEGAVDAAAISRDLEGKGMELVDVFSHPEDGMYAYLARKGDSDLYLAFRGTMCLPSVKVDLDYHPASDDEVDVLRRALAVGGDAVDALAAADARRAALGVGGAPRGARSRLPLPQRPARAATILNTAQPGAAAGDAARPVLDRRPARGLGVAAFARDQS